jgi:hypothetical protein
MINLFSVENTLLKRPVFWWGLLFWTHMAGLMLYQIRSLSTASWEATLIILLDLAFIIVPIMLLFYPERREAAARATYFLFASMIAWLLGPPVSAFLIETSASYAHSKDLLAAIPFSFLFAPYVTLHGLGLSHRDVLQGLDQWGNPSWLHVLYWFLITIVFAPLIFLQSRLSKKWLRVLSVVALLFVLVTLKGCADVTVCEGGC